MWDGRESSPQTGTQKITIATNPADLLADLEHQARDATNGHAQAQVALSAGQQRAITEFEMGLSTAQAIDSHAGPLNDDGAIGGPTALAVETTPAFFLGVNDPLGGNPSGSAFSSKIFTIFEPWMNRSAKAGERGEVSNRRASIARGEVLFNSKPVQITGVGGLNDDLALAVVPGTCGTCHDATNVGNHSLALALDIGVGDLPNPLDLKYLPVFTVQNKTTHEIRVTTDPGR